MSALNLIINLAVGGDFFPEGCVNSATLQKPWAYGTSSQSRSFWWGGDSEYNDRRESFDTWSDPTFQIRDLKIFDDTVEVSTTSETVTETTPETTLETTTETTTETSTVDPNFQLIFHENFENLSNWQHDVTFEVQNNEFQYYRNDRKNSQIENNILTINPSLTVEENGNDAWFLFSGTLNLDESECSNGCSRTGYWDYIIPPVQSAKITTRQSFSFKYGKVEFEAKLPNGDWLWPAVWMMPKNDVYGGWPRSGEIDILEARSNAGLDCDGNEVGRKCAVSTLHYRGGLSSD